MNEKAKRSKQSEPKGYKENLRHLQVELVKLQRHLIKNDLQILVLFEGRDAAGKDGVIKRITQHLSPRETRVVALGKPSVIAIPGIFSATFHICPRPRKWS